MGADVRRCEVRQVDGRSGFCANEVVALACVLENGRARATCWGHLAKVLRQMLAEYQARDFGVRFVARQDEPPARQASSLTGLFAAGGVALPTVVPAAARSAGRAASSPG
jgi:hypothetical protein